MIEGNVASLMKAWWFLLHSEKRNGFLPLNKSLELVTFGYKGEEFIIESLHIVLSIGYGRCMVKMGTLRIILVL